MLDRRRKTLTYVSDKVVNMERAIIEPYNYTEQLINSIGAEISSDAREAVVAPGIEGGGIEFGKIAGIYWGARGRWISYGILRDWVSKKIAPPAEQLDRVTSKVQWGIALHGTSQAQRDNKNNPYANGGGGTESGGMHWQEILIYENSEAFDKIMNDGMDILMISLRGLK